MNLKPKAQSLEDLIEEVTARITDLERQKIAASAELQAYRRVQALEKPRVAAPKSVSQVVPISFAKQVSAGGGGSKLNLTQRAQLKYCVKYTGASDVVLARKFNVTPSMVRKVRLGLEYSDLDKIEKRVPRDAAYVGVPCLRPAHMDDFLKEHMHYTHEFGDR